MRDLRRYLKQQTTKNFKKSKAPLTKYEETMI